MSVEPKCKQSFCVFVANLRVDFLRTFWGVFLTAKGRVAQFQTVDEFSKRRCVGNFFLSNVEMVTEIVKFVTLKVVRKFECFENLQNKILEENKKFITVHIVFDWITKK